MRKYRCWDIVTYFTMYEHININIVHNVYERLMYDEKRLRKEWYSTILLFAYFSIFVWQIVKSKNLILPKSIFTYFIYYIIGVFGIAW